MTGLDLLSDIGSVDGLQSGGRCLDVNCGNGATRILRAQSE